MTVVQQELAKDISEADFQQCVVDYARLRGWLIHHDRPARLASGEWRTAISGDSGFPDLVLARRGVVIFAELKKNTGDTTDAQDKWLGALGTKAYTWKPKHWLSIRAALDGKRVE